MSELVLSYSQCVDRKLVGGKAQRLGDLYRAGISVPPGIVIPTTVSNNAFEITGLPKYDTTPRAKASKPYQISPKRRKAFFDAKVFEELQSDLETHLGGLGTDSYAVRSSAPVEDSKLLSFAGLFDSYLHVSRREVLGTIKKCILSSFNNRAISYARQQGIVLSFEMAVLIQPMIYGNYSGVVFTVSPVQDRMMLVEIVKGLCDKLVLGQVSPTRYGLLRNSGGIGERTESQFTITSDLLESIYRISMQVEKLFETPQDIEFVIRNDKVIIVQSRDIPPKGHSKKQ
jgi:pyruvate,water dikinase